MLIHSRSELENDSFRKHAPKPRRWPPQCFPHCNQIMNCVAPCFSWHPRVFWLGYQAGLALCNQSIMKPTVVFSNYLWKPQVFSGWTLVLVLLVLKFNCIFSLSLFSWEVVNSKPDERPRLSHCIAESWMNFGLFLQEMSLFKQQSPGKASFEILNVAWEQMRWPVLAGKDANLKQLKNWLQQGSVVVTCETLEHLYFVGIDLAHC